MFGARHGGLEHLPAAGADAHRVSAVLRRTAHVPAVGDLGPHPRGEVADGEVTDRLVAEVVNVQPRA